MKDKNFGWTHEEWQLLVQEFLKNNDKTLRQSLEKAHLSNCCAYLKNWLKADYNTALADDAACITFQKTVDIFEALLQGDQIRRHKTGAIAYGNLTKRFNQLARFVYCGYIEPKDNLDKNFGWSCQRFMTLADQLRCDETRQFRQELMPHAKNMAFFLQNLLKKHLKKRDLTEEERSMAQDALNDAFANFEQKVFMGQVYYGNLKDWLVGHALNCYWEIHRKEPMPTKPLDGIVMTTVDSDDFLSMVVGEALANMPNDRKYFYQDTLKLRFWNGWEWEAIATQIGVKADSLRQEWIRNIQPLFRKILQDISLQHNIFSHKISKIIES